MRINILTGPFMCLPPYAIGAVEKLWYSIGKEFVSKGHNVAFISKKPKEENIDDQDVSNVYVKGYDRTGSWLKDLILDLVYSYRALQKMPACDMLVLNSIWSPVLCKLFSNKYKRVMYNVARFPKKQMSLYKAVDCLSCVSTPVMNALIEQSPSMKAVTCVIHNPIDTNVFSPRGEKSLKVSPAIIYSGRVHKEKGLDILVKAVSKLHEKGYALDLRIVGATDIKNGGSGKEYVDYLDGLAQGFYIKWIAPIYDSHKLADELDKADIFCYPSVADKGETFGVAPLEAMGLGLPTIVSDLDCFKDFVTNGENGLVFNHHSQDSVSLLANCIERVISDAAFYKQLSQNAIVTAKTFSVDNIAEKYLRKFNELLING